MKYLLWLAVMFAFCPTIVSGQVVEHHAAVAESAKASSFEHKLDRRVRFDTAGRTLVASIVELVFTYQLPTGIEYADREATTRPLNLHFQNESIRRILEALTKRVPGYGVSFSGGIVDVFAAKGREDPSNLLNKVIKSFESRNWIPKVPISNCLAPSRTKLHHLAGAAEAMRQAHWDRSR